MKTFEITEKKLQTTLPKKIKISKMPTPPTAPTADTPDGTSDNGVTIKTTAKGNRSVSSGAGTYIFSPQGKLMLYMTPKIGGLQQTHNIQKQTVIVNFGTSVDQGDGDVNVSQKGTYDMQGNLISADNTNIASGGYELDLDKEKGTTINYRVSDKKKVSANSKTGVSFSEGVGRITKQNQTVDVGPNEITKQAKKFGNSVDKDGRPPTLSKKVKGSSTNVLFNLGLSEGIMLKFQRGDDFDTLHIKPKGKNRVELRGKPGYESGNYDAQDKLHQVLDNLGKAANFAELMNGETVTINPKHPDGDRAKKTAQDILSTERELTPGEEKEKERIVKGMKKAKSSFKKRYGKDAEAVMYATATKLAKESNDIVRKYATKKNRPIKGQTYDLPIPPRLADAALSAVPGLEKYVTYNKKYGIIGVTLPSGEELENLQWFINQIMPYNTVDVDGKVGPATENAFIYLLYQIAHMEGEEVDPAYMENFADGKRKGKSRPGRVKRSGASCRGSVTSLRKKAKKYSGERGRMYHWCANMKSGRKKK